MERARSNSAPREPEAMRIRGLRPLTTIGESAPPGSHLSGKRQGQAGSGKPEAKPEAFTATIRVASARRANA